MVLLTINSHKGALFTAAKTMSTMKMNQMPQVLLIQILLNYLNQTFVPPGETRTPKADLNINPLFHNHLLHQAWSGMNLNLRL